MPEGLEIDQKSKLDGTMAAYDVHMIIHTGVTDWPSRIEEDERFPEVKILKNMLGKNGKYFNPFHNVMISTSGTASQSNAESTERDAQNLDDSLSRDRDGQYTHPGGTGEHPKHISIIPNILASKPQPVYLPSPFDQIRLGRSSSSFEEAAETLIRESLLPRTLSPQARQFIPEEQHARLLRQPANHRPPSNSTTMREPPQPGRSIQVFICGHGNRGKPSQHLTSGPGWMDSNQNEAASKTHTKMTIVLDQRCGITGPILAQEFKRQLSNIDRGYPQHFDIELISHIGGHKYAGNVILYFPGTQNGEAQPLAGMGIWYGRVEPKHVEGILEQTVYGGRIIKELFRGGIDGCGEQLRLANVESVALGTGGTGDHPASGWLKSKRLDKVGE